MLFNIPQFIEKEDKIVGPLTAKQLGWMAGAGVTLLVLYSLLDTATFYISAIPVIIIFGGLAFYRPYNQSLFSFVISVVFFSFHPKVYVWRRVPEAIKPPKRVIPKKTEKKQERIVDSEKIEEISKLLDKNKTLKF